MAIKAKISWRIYWPFDISIFRDVLLNEQRSNKMDVRISRLNGSQSVMATTYSYMIDKLTEVSGDMTSLLGNVFLFFFCYAKHYKLLIIHEYGKIESAMFVQTDSSHTRCGVAQTRAFAVQFYVECYERIKSVLWRTLVCRDITAVYFFSVLVSSAAWNKKSKKQ